MKAYLKLWIDANVWDGEDRLGASGDSACFSPDDLQELIDDIYDYVIKPEIKALESKLMSKDITADLARESKREAKGVSWDLHQRECDRNEALEYEIEMLRAKVADLMDAMNLNGKALDDLQNELPKIQADGIRKAMMHATQIIDSDDNAENFHDIVCDYADELEAGTL